MEQVKHGYQGVDKSQGQYEVEVVQPIAQVEGGALNTIQGAVAPTKHIVLDEIPQGELQQKEEVAQSQEGTKQAIRSHVMVCKPVGNHESGRPSWLDTRKEAEGNEGTHSMLGTTLGLTWMEGNVMLTVDLGLST